MLVAFALWVVAMAFVYALMTGQAQTDTVGGVARVAALRTLHFVADKLSFHAFRAPTGPLLRVAMTVGRDSTDPEAARPFVYSFLARLAVGRPERGVETEILHDFVKTEQRPATPLESP